jgi:UDP-N-acetylmuramoyl-L-alanyl-D-glutamate--2,6-diaminopimelate ligase
MYQKIRLTNIGLITQIKGLFMRFLTELLANYHGGITIEGQAEGLPISLVTADSRKAIKDSLFVAISGTNDDGTIYALDAVAKGAVAVVTDNESKLILPKSVVIVRVENVRLALSKLAQSFYNKQPSNIAAVTGTDGKTSTADFLRQLWQMDNYKAASIGTLGIIGQDDILISNGTHTTPDPITLQMTMQSLVAEGYEYVAMEASSHGLHQYRLDGVKIKAAAFTNLTREHLDYHKTQEAYFHAKSRLFTEIVSENGYAVLNADDAKFKRLKKICLDRNLKIISFGLNGEDYKITKITPKLDGLAIQAQIMGKSCHFNLNMIGSFQAMNALAALGLYVGCGGDVGLGLSHIPHLHNVAGRLEKVAQHENGAAIYIDYAHTPAALANVLKTIRPHVKGKLILVFGCGGDRDRGKRPEMGAVAQELADIVIVTDDNPRSEKPEAIRAEILFAARKAKNIGDRKEAISTAISLLESNDILLIAGKGHEQNQIIGNQIIPFNDALVAQELV